MSIREKIIRYLKENGAKSVAEMHEALKLKSDSIRNRCLELQKEKVLARDAEDRWVLTGITEQEVLEVDENQNKKNSKNDPPQDKSLDPRAQFEDILISLGVKKEVAPTFADHFFRGNIDSLEWLREVLLRHAAGFIRADQARSIISIWSKARNLPYNADEFFLEEKPVSKTSGGVSVEQQKPLAAQVIEKTGIGWKIGKDQDGDWIAIPGGPMTYQEAVEAAERRQALKAMSAGYGSGDDSVESGEVKPAVRSTKPAAKNFQEIFLEKVLEKILDNGDRKPDPAVQALQAQLAQANTLIQQLKEQQENDRLERLEAAIASLAAKDPWNDPVQIARARQVLGVNNNTVTDSSPAVQVIKDTSDKVDRNLGRLIGILEQQALKNEVFKEEKTRSPEEKETKAAELLNEAQNRTRAIELRKKTFGY